MLKKEFGFLALLSFFHGIYKIKMKDTEFVIWQKAAIINDNRNCNFANAHKNVLRCRYTAFKKQVFKQICWCMCVGVAVCRCVCVGFRANKCVLVGNSKSVHLSLYSFASATCVHFIWTNARDERLNEWMDDAAAWKTSAKVKKSTFNIFAMFLARRWLLLLPLLPVCTNVIIVKYLSQYVRVNLRVGVREAVLVCENVSQYMATPFRTEILILEIFL